MKYLRELTAHNLTTPLGSPLLLGGDQGKILKDYIDAISGNTTFNNPTFTGNVDMDGAESVTAPTPITSDNSTKIATTAFVNNAGYLKPAVIKYFSYTVPVGQSDGELWYSQGENVIKRSVLGAWIPVSLSEAKSTIYSNLGRELFKYNGLKLTNIGDLSDYAPINNPEFTGTPLSTKPSSSASGKEITTVDWFKFASLIRLGYNIPDTVAGYGSILLGIDSGKVKVGGVTTLIGNGSGAKCTTADEVVAIGGSGVLVENTTGSDIVAIGTLALRNNVSESGSVAIGRGAGSNSSNAKNSVFIGKDSQAKNTTSDNEIVIGYNAVGNGNDTVTIGNDSITNTYIKGILNVNTTKYRYIKPTINIPSLSYGKVLTVAILGNQNGPLTYINVVSTTDFPQEGSIYIESVDAHLYYTSKDSTKFYLESAAEISILDGESVSSDGIVYSFATLNPVANISVIELYSNSNSLYFNAGDTLNYEYNSVVYSYPIIGLTSTSITCSGNIPVRNFEQNTNGNLYITRNASNGNKNALDLYVVDGITPYNNAIVNYNIKPLSNNIYSIGSPEFKFKDIFVQSAAFNGSDARLKTDIVSFTQDELNASKQLSKEIGTYKWLSAIQEKGENARKHIGMTVQRAIEIMLANNLNPFEYGFIGYDEWQDEFETIPAVEAKEAWIEEVKSTRYEIITIPATEDEPEKQEVIEVEYVRETIEHPAIESKAAYQIQTKVAGNIYSFRYTELLAFISRGFEERLSLLENK